MRQHQAIEATVLRTDGAIGVGILLRYHGIDERSNWATAPTVACVRDASETRLVLEHQLDGALLRPVRADFGKALGEFFFHSS